MTISIPESQQKSLRRITTFLIIAFFGLGSQHIKAQKQTTQHQDITKTKSSNDVIEYKGIVIDKATDEPMPGVEVIIKGTKIVIMTDIKGEFTIKSKRSNILIFKFIGYEIEEFKLKKKPKIMIKMDSIPTPGVVIITKGKDYDDE